MAAVGLVARHRRVVVAVVGRHGASDFLVEALGEVGQHSRSAVSVNSLPFGVAVEIEGVFQIS